MLEKEGLDKIDEKQGSIPVNNFIKANEKLIPKTKKFLSLNKSIIIEGNFYHKEQLDNLIKELKGSKNHIFTLKASLKTCIKRDAERKKSYGKKNVEEVYTLVSKFDYGIVVDTESKTEKEVIEDIKKYINEFACLSSNVKEKKDVIKIHTNSEWNYALDNLVAIFSDPKARKSCRVSEFDKGKRIKKWTFKEYDGNSDSCINEKCITHPEYGEGIKFEMYKKEDGKLECPYCHTLQK